MKKSQPLLIALFLVLAGHVSAQIQNAGFEQFNSDGTPQHWGRTYLFAVTIDTNGQQTGDSLVIDQAFYAPTTDAHSGNFALELRNAYNYTTDTPIEGGIMACPDTVFATFATTNPLNAAMNERPTQLGFYYKYFPAGPDWAWAYTEIYDSTGNVIGQASIFTPDSAAEWSYIYAPIDYWMEGQAAYYTLSFSTAAPCGMASYGTRFLVDDVEFTTTITASGVNENENISYEVFPNPTTDKVFINTEQNIKVYIFNSKGQLMQTTSLKNIDMAGFASGAYYLKICGENLQNQTVKIIKK